MKKCTVCKFELSLDQFYRNKRSADGMQPSCKKCADEGNTRSRKKHPVKAKAARAAYKQRILMMTYEYKSSRGCVVCGETEPTCLDLHHLDPTTKDLDASVAMSEAVFLKEAAKCIVICANHHRQLHAKVINIDEICRLGV
jgi:hypothetical protein